MYYRFLIWLILAEMVPHEHAVRLKILFPFCNQTDDDQGQSTVVRIELCTLFFRQTERMYQRREEHGIVFTK